MIKEDDKNDSFDDTICYFHFSFENWMEVTQYWTFKFFFLLNTLQGKSSYLLHTIGNFLL